MLYSLLRYASVVSILIVLTVAGLEPPNLHPVEAAQAANQDQNRLDVKYANNVAESYFVLVNSNEKYTVSQTYSWVRDDSSRYNLVSYSIDNGNPMEIPRNARGSFSLDVPMDSGHTVIFFAIIQYPISTRIDTDTSAINNIAQFNPPSPTGDNWFDTNTSIAVRVPYHLDQDQQSRRQLVAWAIDTSNPKEILLSNSENQMGQAQNEEFSTPSIIIASKHNFVFYTMDQYYLQVISEHGTVIGGGWYDSGSEATILAKPVTNLLVNYIFEEPEGTHWTEGNGYSAKVLMDSPKTLVVKFNPDYSQLIIVLITGAVIAIVAAAVTIKRKGMNKVSVRETPLPILDASIPTRAITTTRSSAALLQEQHEGQSSNPDVKDDSNSNQKIIGDEYARDIMHFALIKSLESLESLHASGLVPNSRIAGTRQKLEQSFG